MYICENKSWKFKTIVSKFDADFELIQIDSTKVSPTHQQRAQIWSSRIRTSHALSQFTVIARHRRHSAHRKSTCLEYQPSLRLKILSWSNIRQTFQCKLSIYSIYVRLLTETEKWTHGYAFVPFHSSFWVVTRNKSETISKMLLCFVLLHRFPHSIHKRIHQYEFHMLDSHESLFSPINSWNSFSCLLSSLAFSHTCQQEIEND